MHLELVDRYRNGYATGQTGLCLFNSTHYQHYQPIRFVLRRKWRKHQEFRPLWAYLFPLLAHIPNSRYRNWWLNFGLLARKLVTFV